MRLIFAFGISFQFLIILNLLARIGIVNSQYLKVLEGVIVIIYISSYFNTPR